MNKSHDELNYEDELRPWEVETTFNDVLAQQLAHAPYFIASIVLHFLIGLIVAGIMVLTAKPEDEVPTLVAAPPPPPPEIEEEEEPEPEIIEEPIEEPVIVESDLEEVVEQETLQEDGDPDMNSDAAFDSDAWNNDVGLGGGAGGKMGGRGGRGGGGGSKTEAAVQDALKWLRDHQSSLGFWDSDEFMYNDVYPDKPQSDGYGNSVNDVGLTGLALLAFLGNNQTMDKGKFKNVVKSGVNWLKDNQDEDGLFGEEVGNATLYNHSIATMAVGEAYYFSKQSPLLKRPMKKAIQVLVKAQNPYNAWRYSLEPNNDNDSSITGWMVFALKTAKENKMDIDNAAFAGAENWFTTMTDPTTGRTGYGWMEGGGGPGSLPSRQPQYIDKFPAHKSESLTAVALLSRMFMTDGRKVTKWTDHPQYDMLKKQALLISATPPKWDENDGSIDMYYWYYGTFAMKQWGGKLWEDWRKAIEKALIPNQRREDKEDNYYGSWDAAGAWGHDGGRVYSTAICALMLEVYYRYAQVLGAR
jgi:hypothetical protein